MTSAQAASSQWLPGPADDQSARDSFELPFYSREACVQIEAEEWHQHLLDLAADKDFTEEYLKENPGPHVILWTDYAEERRSASRTAQIRKEAVALLRPGSDPQLVEAVAARVRPGRIGACHPAARRHDGTRDNNAMGLFAAANLPPFTMLGLYFGKLWMTKARNNWAAEDPCTRRIQIIRDMELDKSTKGCFVIEGDPMRCAVSLINDPNFDAFKTGFEGCRDAGSKCTCNHYRERQHNVTSCEAALVFWTESGPCCWPFIYYYTSRRVGEGEELLMNYGDDYWKLLVEEHRNGRNAAAFVELQEAKRQLDRMRACVASADADRDALRRALRRSVEASLKEATRIIQETGHIVDKLSQGHEPKDGQDQDLREIDQLKDNLKVAREEAADSQKQISRLKDELATCKFRLSEMNVRANEEVQKEKEVTRDALERLDMLELKLREAKEEAKQCRDALNKQEQTMDLVVGRLAEARHDLHKSRSASEDVKRLESPGTEANKISTCRESIWAGSLQPRRDLYRSASPASGGRPTIAFARVGEPAVSAAGLQHSMDVNRIDSLAGGGWPTIACTGVGESTSLDGSLQQRLDLIRTGSPAGGLRPITACTHVGEAVVSASSWQRRMDANKTNSPASGGRPTIACTHAGEPAVLDSSLPYRMDVNQTDSYAREGWPRIDPTRVGEPSQAVRPVDVISITSQPSGDERTKALRAGISPSAKPVASQVICHSNSDLPQLGKILIKDLPIASANFSQKMKTFLSKHPNHAVWFGSRNSDTIQNEIARHMDEQAFEARLFRGDHVYGIPSFARISACGGRKIRYFMVPWPQCHSDYDAFEIKRVLMGSKTSCFESCLDCYLPVDDMEVVVCPADSDVKVLVHYEPVVMHIGVARALQKLGKEYLGFELKVTAFTDLLQGHLTTKVDMLQLYQPRDEEEYGKASAWKVYDKSRWMFSSEEYCVVQRRSDVHSTPDLWDIVRQSEMPDEGLGEPLWSAEASSAMVDHDEQEELPDDVLQILCSEHVERQKLINDIKSSPREYIHQFQWSPVWKKLLGVDGGNRGGRSILRGTKRAAGRSFTNSRGGRGRIR